VVKLKVDGSKICYQCDQKHPSSWWKFWGEKITRCHGIPFEKYATKTSKAFGTSVLTCYTVIFLIQLFLSQLYFTSSHPRPYHCTSVKLSIWVDARVTTTRHTYIVFKIEHFRTGHQKTAESSNINSFFSSYRNSMKQVPLLNVVLMDWEKHLIKLSNVEIVIIHVATKNYATNIRKHLAHHHVSADAIIGFILKRKLNFSFNL